MNNLIRWIVAYFDLSRSEANGFLILMSLMLISILGLFYYKNSPRMVPVANQASLDSLLAEIRDKATYDSVVYEPRTNKAPKVYSRQRKQPDRPKLDVTKYRPRYKQQVILPFDINYADTSQLKKLRGVGPVLSKRIIKFRDVLGGYVNIRQLAEVYGLQDSVLLQMDTLIFITRNFQPSKINVNEASEQDLSKHPYINRSVAKAIVRYRFQQGAFTSTEELSNIHLIDSLTLAKITPYISF